jgi:hypothetical protein
MPALDRYHLAVKHALERDGWVVTAENSILEFGGVKMYLDIRAELEYQAILEQLILAHQQESKKEHLEHQVILDSQRGHYQVLTVGWKNGNRVYDVLLHVDFKDNKFWVQQDYTLPSLTDQLLEAGVPKSDIVLGFHPPQARELTEFAVA